MASLATRFTQISSRSSWNTWRVILPHFSRALSENTPIEHTSKEAVVKETSTDEIVEVSSITGLPKSQLGRKALIFRPPLHSMQSGSNNTLKWKLEFENQERWENPLMGWASRWFEYFVSGDPLSNMNIAFDTQEQAIAFAQKNGWTYEVVEPQAPKFRIKTYGENFSWDKKTRVTSK